MNNKINWFPGHMSVQLRSIGDQIKQCDALVYVLDARCPKSCLNPEFEKLTNRRPVVFVENKGDLTYRAPKKVDIVAELARLFPNKVGFIRAMVIGVPNVGKSTIINRLAKRKKAQTGNKPGVTKQPQWVEVAPRVYLLDTPGVLYPDLKDQRAALNLAYIGSIKDDVLDLPAVARALLVDLKALNPRFDGARVIESEQDARMLLTDFRAGKLGKYNLDKLLGTQTPMA